MSNQKSGIIVKISGPVLDVQFSGGNPDIHNLLVSEDGVSMEVATHVSENMVRCISLQATDGMRCGTVVTDTGHPISVPVGENMLGRVTLSYR